MTIAADITQAVRVWLKATAVSGSSLTDSQVIPADDNGPRPALPYATVRVLSPDIADGPDETRYGVDGSDNPTQTIAGPRRGTVSVTVYGASGADWLGRATLMLQADATRAALDAAGYSAFTIVPQGGAAIRFDAPERDTVREPMWVRDYDVLYLLLTEAQTLTPLDYAETAIGVTGSGSTLSTTLTSTVP